MITTYFLGAVLGWYLVIGSIFLIFKHHVVDAIMRDLLAQPTLLYIVATFTLIMGLLMVVSHNFWVLGWPVIITLISWLVLLSGLLRLYFPEVIERIWLKLLNHSTGMTIIGVVSLIIGLFLLFCVYFW